MSRSEQETGFNLLWHPKRHCRNSSDVPGGGYPVTPLVTLWVFFHTPNPCAPALSQDKFVLQSQPKKQFYCFILKCRVSWQREIFPGQTEPLLRRFLQKFGVKVSGFLSGWEHEVFPAQEFRKNRIVPPYLPRAREIGSSSGNSACCGLNKYQERDQCTSPTAAAALVLWLILAFPRFKFIHN